MLTVSGRRVLLRDEDSSSVTIGKNERRLNTLLHYHVVDGCTLAVVTPYTANTRYNGQSTGSKLHQFDLLWICQYCLVCPVRSHVFCSRTGFKVTDLTEEWLMLLSLSGFTISGLAGTLHRSTKTADKKAKRFHLVSLHDWIFVNVKPRGHISDMSKIHVETIK